MNADHDSDHETENAAETTGQTTDTGGDEVVDLYARSADKFRQPPRGVFSTLRQVGPGLILVGSIVGSGELIMTTKLGAQAGFALLWAVVLSCIVKTVVQAELGRHVISSGDTILEMFNKLPGPRGPRPTWLGLEWMAVVLISSLVGFVISTQPWAAKPAWIVGLLCGVPAIWIVAAVLLSSRSKERHATTSRADATTAEVDKPARPVINWFIWIWLAGQMVMFINGGAIIGGAGQALALADTKVRAHYDLPGEPDARFWTIVVAVVCAALLLSGRYKMLELFSVGMVSTFTLITLVCTVMLQWTGNAITPDDIRQGLRFWELPFDNPKIVLTALAMYAGTGIGTWEMMHYTYWCVEKGYARNTGANQPGEAWPERARGWIRVMYVDVLLTMVIFTVSTICFYFLGAAILYPDLDPSGKETVATLAGIFTKSLGDWASTLFVVGSFVVLFSTTFSSAAGSSRLMADGMCVMGVIDRKDYRSRLRFIRFFIVLSLTMSTLTYWFLENPPLMLMITAFVSVILYPILGLGTLYLRYQGVDGRIAPGRMVSLWLWICALLLAIISPVATVFIVMNK